MYSLLTQLITTAVGNPITDSALFQGVESMLKDITSAAMIIAPLVCVILVIFFSLRMSASSEPHDKEKWSKARKNTLITVGWVFGAVAIINIIMQYFGTAAAA